MSTKLNSHGVHSTYSSVLYCKSCLNPKGLIIVAGYVCNDRAGDLESTHVGTRLTYKRIGFEKLRRILSFHKHVASYVCVFVWLTKKLWTTIPTKRYSPPCLSFSLRLSFYAHIQTEGDIKCTCCISERSPACFGHRPGMGIALSLHGCGIEMSNQNIKTSLCIIHKKKGPLCVSRSVSGKKVLLFRKHQIFLVHNKRIF